MKKKPTVTAKPATGVPAVTRAQEFEDLYMELFLDWSRLREQFSDLQTLADKAAEEAKELRADKARLEWCMRRIQGDMGRVLGDYDDAG